MTSLIWIVLDILEYLQLGGGLSRKLRQSLVEGHHSAMFHVVAGRAETLFVPLNAKGDALLLMERPVLICKAGVRT